MLYTETDINLINKLRERNDKLEIFFSEKREEWGKRIGDLIASMEPILTRDSSLVVLDIQSKTLTYKQTLLDEQSALLNKLSKADSKVKKIRGEKFVFFATGFGIKTNLGEKNILIESHISEELRNIELIQNHIEYIRASIKNLETLQYSIKNTIELFNYLSK